MENYYKCYQWLTLVVFALVLFQTKADDLPPLIFPEKALAMGALCLDGSPPAYMWEKADDENKDNWLLYFEGGAWCTSIEECKGRTTEHKGSSHHMIANSTYPGDNKDFGWSGIFYTPQGLNPTEFRTWNKVVLRYCDQSSFTGDVEQPVEGLYFRGKRILDVLIDELLSKGLKDAKQVFLTGGSAGGVSVALHCQRFRDILPSTTKFKCLIDGGYFVHAKDPKLAEPFEALFSGVVALHNSTVNLPDACPYKNVKGKEYLCFFAQYVVPHIDVPVFIMMTPYDSFQMNTTLGLEVHTTAKKAWNDGTSLAMSTYKILQDFRLNVLDAIELSNKPANALYISNCFDHTQLTFHWNLKGYAVNNLTDVDAISNWYFDRREVKEIDQSVLLKDCDHDRYVSESIKRLT